MSIVGVKNLIGAFLTRNKSDDELERVDRLLENNQNPYGSTDRGQEVAVEESVLNAMKSVNEGDDDDVEDMGFFNKFDPRVMSDIIIGLSDGLTVPFALTAGLSSLGDSKISYHWWYG
jgi:hypothetical protein